MESYLTTQNSRGEALIPTPKGFLGSGQPTGLPPKPDLSRYVQTHRPTAETKAPTKPEPTRKPRGVSCSTLRGKVLEVLHEQTSAISTEDVVIACWRRWPEQFGMAGYPQYPCTNTVYAKLATLTTEGFVHRPCTGMVQITPKGLAACKAGKQLDLVVDTSSTKP